MPSADSLLVNTWARATGACQQQPRRPRVQRRHRGATSAGPTRDPPSGPGSIQGTTTTARTFHRPASSPHLRVVSSTLGDDGGGELLPLLPLSPPPGASARQLSVGARSAGRATLRQVRVAVRQVRHGRGAEAAGHVQTRGRACMVAMWVTVTRRRRVRDGANVALHCTGALAQTLTEATPPETK